MAKITELMRVFATFVSWLSSTYWAAANPSLTVSALGPGLATETITAAAPMAGTLSRNVNRADASRLMPSNIPAVIVAPDRDTPGTGAKACAAPMPSAPGIDKVASVPVRGLRRSTRNSSPAPAISANAVSRG
jgi:hypothetical protein